MGFLKNIIRRAIGEGISGGISKAVEGSVRKAVQPAADRWAQKQAENIDQMSKAAEELSASQAAYAQAMSNAAQELNQAAAQVDQGNAGSAGAARAAAAFPKLTKEQYAAAVKATFASDPAALQEFREKLPGFPIWCFGGTNISVDEYGRSDAGWPYYSLTVHNTSLEALIAYSKLLQQCGFTCLNPADPNVLRKALPNGEYLFFSMYEAMSGDTSFSAALYRTTDPTGA